MNEDKAALAIARAARADALRKDDLLNEAFVEYEKTLVERWKAWPAGDTDGRERIWQAVNIIGKVKDHLLKVVNDGKIAKDAIEQLHPNKQ